jgi:tetratricopeptide (TPR) repeat protein
LAVLRVNWAYALVQRGQAKAALADLLKTIPPLEDLLRQEPNYDLARDRLYRVHSVTGQLLRGEQRYVDALHHYQRAVELARPAEEPDFQRLVSALSDAYARRHAKVEPLLRELVAVARQSEGADSPTYAEHLAPLGQNLLVQRKYAEAETVLRECLGIRQKKLPDHWATFHTQSMLGGALLGQKKYAEAEPLLLQGYGGMKQRQAKIPRAGQVHVSETLEQLVHLYDAWGKKDEAAKWRKHLEPLKTPKPKPPPKEK